LGGLVGGRGAARRRGGWLQGMEWRNGANEDPLVPSMLVKCVLRTVNMPILCMAGTLTLMCLGSGG
jgi:hypothetical protein